MIHFMLKIIKHSSSPMRIFRSLFALFALTVVCSSATIFAQSRTTPSPQTSLTPIARGGLSPTAPSVLNPAQLTAIRAAGEHSLLLLKFPIDVAWGLP